jgi:hypothetical protein
MDQSTFTKESAMREQIGWVYVVINAADHVPVEEFPEMDLAVQYIKRQLRGGYAIVRMWF